MDTSSPASTTGLGDLSDSGSSADHRQQADVIRPPAGHWRLALPMAGNEAALLIDRRALVANLGLLLALLILGALSLCLGSVTLSPLASARALFGQGSAMDSFLIHELRLPRLAAGIATGGAFALSGCLMQTLARNRLATPGIIGIDNGATAFAVASVVGLGVSLAPPALALVGAATATALTFGLAGGIGTRGYRFIVAGIGVGAVFGALTQLMLARVDIDTANAAYPWTVGSLNARDPVSLKVLEVSLLIGLLLSRRIAQALNVLRFSDSVAAGLGIQVTRCRRWALMLSVSLTALAVSVAGPVGMVALIGPELARHLSSPRGVPLVGSALAGALVMVSADLAGRLMLAPLEIPVGIVTAVIGGPVLLWILLRPTRKVP
ncbi:FecCD family ABC transporter permease [Onishia niordana]|uniref:FecCD family ABC transporter permease n=1 Tax=Onishia niordana TaxID=2508711 RepID=UPI0010A06320|nr:iron ABC transporter permease [Halomonas niordiana]